MHRLFTAFLQKIKIQTTPLYVPPPVTIGLEPTISCNAACAMCTREAISYMSDMPDDGYLSWAVFEKVKPIIRTAKHLCFSGFGEPFLHPEYFKFVREIKRLNPNIWLSLYTNGSLIDARLSESLIDEKVDEIYVSLGGATSATHSQTHGIALDYIIENLEILNRIKKNKASSKPALSLNVATTMSSLKELPQLFRLAEKLDVEKVCMIPFYVYDKQFLAESPWSNIEEARRIADQASTIAKGMKFRYVPPNLVESFGDCKRFFKELYILWNGAVLSCCMERHFLGDLMHGKSIQEIWNGDSIMKLRQLYKKKGIGGACPKCDRGHNTPVVFLDPLCEFRQEAIGRAR